MPAIDSRSATAASRFVDYAGTLDCIHCGLCLQTCPTFRLTGVETSSPRGRIHLMRAVGEGRLTPDKDYAEELDFCLLCRHCESVCPAGVRFGTMMEEARFAREENLPRGPLVRFARWLGLRVVLPRRSAQRLAADGLRLLQRTGLDRALALIGPRLGLSFASGLGHLPRVQPRRERPLLSDRIPPRAGASAQEDSPEVFLLQGCIQADLLPEVNPATARALSALGFTTLVPALPCCGSLHAHNGDREGARALARRVIATFGSDPKDERPILMNSAGCGAHLKELHHLFPADDPWHDRARRIAERVLDFSVFVAPHIQTRRLRVDPALLPLAWDDPCHLCHAQGVRDAPRTILGSVSQLDEGEGQAVVPLAGSESCCGSAGIYSILRPEDSRAVFAPKLEAFVASGARTLITANPGCQIQWATGLQRAGLKDARVLSLSELVALGLDDAGSS